MTCTLTTSPILPAALRTGVDGRLDGGHVADDEGRHQSAADLLPADHLHVGRFQHRVGGFDQRHKPLGFDHAQGFHRLSP